MSGSVAEERIRAKTVAMMRRNWPDARIIHELQLEQFGVRIDLAAITRDRIYLAEIKSERDTLKRLPSQLERAVEVANTVWICLAEPQEKALRGSIDCCGDAAARRLNSLVRRCRVLVERSSDELCPSDIGGAWHEQLLPDPRALFDLLWSVEMRVALRPHGGPGRVSRRAHMTGLAVEHLTGRQIREAVCAQLRGRPFPRADAAERDAA